MKLVEQFNADINKMSERIINKVMSAQQEAGQKICKDIKIGAPIKSGSYRDSINVSETKLNGTRITTTIYSTMTLGQRASGEINSKWDRVPLAVIIEHGTKPHFITPKKPDGILRWKDDDGIVHYAKWVWHPGTIANPHWSNALVRNRSYYSRMIRKALRKGK